MRIDSRLMKMNKMTLFSQSIDCTPLAWTGLGMKDNIRLLSLKSALNAKVNAAVAKAVLKLRTPLLVMTVNLAIDLVVFGIAWKDSAVKIATESNSNRYPLCDMIKLGLINLFEGQKVQRTEMQESLFPQSIESMLIHFAQANVYASYTEVQLKQQRAVSI